MRVEVSNIPRTPQRGAIALSRFDKAPQKLPKKKHTAILNAFSI
jgi:hypothetical protein